MFTLTGWIILLLFTGISIYLIRLCFKNKQPPSGQNDVEPSIDESSVQKQRALRQLERNQLEHWIYNQWELRISERLEQWRGNPPEQHIQTEWQQVQQVRERLEQERKEWEQQKKQQRAQLEQEWQDQSKSGFQPVGKIYIEANWYRILGLAPTAGAEEIKRAYHKGMSEYHPDKVAKMGDKIQELAKVESQKINAAYEYAQSRGRV